jgi:secreted trypsin-like serine protease
MRVHPNGRTIGRAAFLAAALGGLVLAPGAAQAALAAPPGTDIVGGTRAAEGEFPFMVRLSMGCGGSLLSPRVVLTAAHCVDGTGATTRYTVSGGGVDRNGFQYQATSTYVYSGYDVRQEADFALVKLDADIPTGTISVNTDAANNDGDFTIMGWGDTSEGGTDSQYLLKAQVPFVDDQVCGTNYRDAGYEFTDTDMMCAGPLSGGTDTCQGDSGGPMVKMVGSDWQQVGIVSWGAGCARANLPGVYTEASTFAQDIQAAADALP